MVPDFGFKILTFTIGIINKTKSSGLSDPYFGLDSINSHKTLILPTLSGFHWGTCPDVALSSQKSVAGLLVLVRTLFKC